MRLNNKIALVTGSTKGIGEAIAVRFAEEGARVLVTGRSRDLGEAVAQRIRDGGGEAVFVATDVGVEDDVRAAVQTAVDIYGGLDIVVNNAAPIDLMAAGTDRKVVGMETADLDAMLRVGLYGPFWFYKYAIPVMARGGVFINISALTAMLGVAGLPGYTMCKGAVGALTRQVAVDYAAQGIRSNTIVVGFVVSSETTQQLMEIPAVAAAMADFQLTRIGRSLDIAHAAVYLASDESEFLTGVTLVADGGTAAKANLPDAFDLMQKAGMAPASEL